MLLLERKKFVKNTAIGIKIVFTNKKDGSKKLYDLTLVSILPFLPLTW